MMNSESTIQTVWVPTGTSTAAHERTSSMEGCALSVMRLETCGVFLEISLRNPKMNSKQLSAIGQFKQTKSRQS